MEGLENLFCHKSANESFITRILHEEMAYSQIFVELVKHLMMNPIFSGGLFLSIIGFFGYYAIWVWDLVKALFNQYFFNTLEMTNENVVYNWIIGHINEHSKWKTNNIAIESEYDADEGTMDHKFLPGSGSHYFYYKDRWVHFERRREKEKTGNPRLEVATLSTYRGSPEFWKEFIEDCTQEYLAEVKKGLIIYYPEPYCNDEWLAFGKPRRKRPLDSVILEEGLSERLVDDLKDFLVSADWYMETGVPYRRGYLLYGPPGTGKSSYIGALASHMGYGICVASLNEKGLDDGKVNRMFNNSPTKTFILLEDIDAAFISHQRKKTKKSDKPKKETPENPDSELEDENEEKEENTNGVTLSGLLNAIDGVASSEERIIFMTTNYKERLDSALIRPGRIDFEAYFGHCTPCMIERMFKKFYGRKMPPDELEKKAKMFSEKVETLEKPISPADLQKHLIVFKNDPQGAVENVAMI